MQKDSVYVLKKIIKVQEITIREKERGATQKWIYENLIRDEFFISLSTFNNYLARNAKKELKELEDETKGNK
ncbi:hypothetical protein [uncultured Sunxiuqinia sp.]|uniref:hypothetical protein n=1 Tax=uncultured Sunxiuqinia sp. TaxID=1573825 RepID=UPI002AA74EEC|nr:hypothetical protein [uncultured Sunxiuqinia sp.]